MNEIRTSVEPSRPGRYVASVHRGLAVGLCMLLLVVAAAPAGAATRPAPPIAGTTLDGKRLALGNLRGKPVVINVWSSW
jgi:cytochrome c biogenesis protein CcmG, thiol:disulfide interchange protein DsbE